MTVAAIAVSPKVIRAWAVDNGFPQIAGKNGRLPSRVIEAYAAAHPQESA